MAESAEHSFLKHEFLRVLESFSQLDLYGLVEAERKTFDLACGIKREWSRPLVGQVLWGHQDGIEKDLRTLLHEPDAEIRAYVARDGMRARRAIEDVTSSYRTSGDAERLLQLRVFWLPADFDADDEKQRTLARQILKSAVVDDVLFHIVFGNLTKNDVRMFLGSPGLIGLNLAALHEISTQGFLNITSLAKKLAVSTGPVRERLLILQGAGFLESKMHHGYYEVTTRGRLFLDLVSRLVRELRAGKLTAEMHYLLGKLGCAPRHQAASAAPHQEPFAWLVATLEAVHRNWGRDLSCIQHVARHPDLPPQST